ncbi:TetR family transcriptional regulatory protein [Gloeobacter violaceus PCC 7421]|uniref:TetR family transcriptional regulatory protein n=2 Tax=Gloeobacter violaceus TaxID=33072 RepID=Q7NKR0_GLOVI|nr:TetR family transcriptional regulatory protein [Gloeobacter violaceus PCC 7421]
MPKVDPKFKELRREQILQAAVTCFARKGFHAATTDDICAEARLSPGSIYRYFHNKEAIMLAIAQSHQQVVVGWMQEAAQRTDVIEALAMFAARFVGELDAPNARIALEIVVEAGRNPTLAAQVSRYDEEVNDGIVDLLLSGKQRGQIAADIDFVATAFLLRAAIEGLGIAMTLERRVEPEAALAEFRGWLVRLFGPP